jgi:predicted ATPase/DNA-binding XRE family transcriptional regulator
VNSLDGERLESRTSPFGTLLRTHRLVAGLSQDELAEKARMSVAGISALERGIRRTPQRETLILLTNALGLAGKERHAFETAAKQRNPRAPFAESVFFESDESGSENHNLPLQLSSFIGREHEVQEIAALAKAHRLVTITGSGGVGKTRTALAVGGELLDRLNDGVWLVELAPLSDAAAMASTLALAVGIQESPDRPLLETLLAHLKNKALLIILDNCDRVISEAAALAETLLRGCPRLRLLVTSRESLRTAGEQVYRLPSLMCPTPRDAARLGASQGAGYAAIVLFSERAHAKDGRFALSDENAPVVADICLRLDGIPLAIELAAARIKVFSIQVLLQKLEQRFRILTAGDRTALPRHQTMRALIDWSYDLLTSSEQHLFDCLSLFAGGCTLAAATAVRTAEGEKEPDTFDILSSLVDKSLVVADTSAPETRYRLLESSRQYASEKLVERGEQVSETHRRAHARAYLEVAQWLEQAWDTTPDRRWSALAEVELENCRAVLDWALGTRGDVLLGQRLAGAMYWVWITFGTVEGRRWINIASQFIDDWTPLDAVAKIRLAEGVLALWIGEHQAALISGTSALTIYRELENQVEVARAQCLVGRSLVLLRRVSEGEAILLELLKPARARGTRSLIGYVLDSIALARSLSGDIASARRYYAEALVVFETLGAERSTAAVMHDLAQAEFRAGNSEGALRLESDALGAFRALNHTHYVTYALANMVAALESMTAILMELARYGDARAHALEALDLSRELQLSVFTARTLQHLAAIALLHRQGDASPLNDQHARAARILGFADGWLTQLKIAQEYGGQQEYDQAISIVQDTLGIDQTRQLIAIGTTMTERQAVEEALLFVD